MAKKIASGHLPQTRGQNRVAEMARKIAQEKEKQLAEDPLILDELPILEPDPDMFPNKIVAAVVGTYQWGENDILAIKRDLGYGASEITSNCQLRLEIIVKAKNKTSSPKGVLLAGTRAELRYESDVGGISLFPSALCFPPKTPLPRRGGLIKRSGANLAIHLPGIAQCKYEAAFPPQSVQIQYLGDGKANCQFK